MAGGRSGRCDGGVSFVVKTLCEMCNLLEFVRS